MNRKTIRINGEGHLGNSIASWLTRDGYGEGVRVIKKSQHDPYDEYADIIIHTSWQTNVDACTTEADRSSFICFKGLNEAIKMSVDYGSKIIFISSAYVFSGENTPEEGYESRRPIDVLEDIDYKNNILSPRSKYGLFKLQAENKVLYDWWESKQKNTSASVKYLPTRRSVVIRTDALYGEFKKYKYPKGAIDQISNPTYIPYLGEVVAKMAKKMTECPSFNEYVGSKNVFHVVGPEQMSRHEFIKRFSNPHVQECTMKELDLPAIRPKNSSLKNDDDLIEMLGIHNPTLDEVKEILSDRLF